MSLVHMNIIMTFTTSLMGSLMYLSHLMFSLLCLESMMLSLFILAALTTLNSHVTLASVMPITLLVFAAGEAALVLALSVTVSNKYGTDYMQNLNLLQCWNLSSPQSY